MISKKLLSLLLGKEVEDLEIEDNYLNYEIVNPQNKGEYHTSGIKLDALGQLYREWIKNKVFDLIKSNFATPNFKPKEEYTFRDMDISPDEVNALSEMLIVEFELVDIEFSRVMEWQAIGDVVKYIEEAIIEEQF